MRKTKAKTQARPDSFAPLTCYTLDGQNFQNWQLARDYLLEQEFTNEEADQYLMLLSSDYVERMKTQGAACFA